MRFNTDDSVALTTHLAPDEHGLGIEPTADEHSAGAPNQAPATLSEALEEACSNDIQTEEADEIVDAGGYREWLQLVSGRLSVSTTAEHLHLAALLAKDPANRLGLITRAISATPSDPFVLWSAVRLCNEYNGADCPLDDWIARLVPIDGENSMTWAQLAAHRYRTGDRDGAMAALQRGASAATASDYWIDVVVLSERSLAAASNLGFALRTSFAFGIAAAQMPSYADLVSMCRAEVGSSADWAYACRDFGEQLEMESRNELAAMMGIAVQTLGLEALGDTEQAATVETRKAARRERMEAAGDSLDNGWFYLIASSPTFFEAYIERIRAEGEMAAAISFSAELQTLIDRHPDLACIPLQ